ncbi:Uncharacterised protein [Salmonella enterica subsp. enterica]|uniref:Uncharacterized protein n=1 Tax=Salmonella enterica I TaxID=59201 RepID=A0A379WVV1_SALET|nr:Uncharacterised protein [Salmonella enterica subsp. enterica]
MGRVGYVKAGYRWLRWHTFLVPIQTMPEPICAERRNCLLEILKVKSRKIPKKRGIQMQKKSVYTSFFMQHFMQDKTNITL